LIDTVSTFLSGVLAFSLAWLLGPLLGHLSAKRRLARFFVGLLTELRMLPVLVALVPFFEARFGLPSFAVIGLLGAASRTAAVARFVATEEQGRPPAPRPLRLDRLFEADQPRGAARTALLFVVPEVALLEGLRIFFSEGQGRGLGAALARGQLVAIVPLLLLGWATIVVLERGARERGAPPEARAST